MDGGVVLLVGVVAFVAGVVVGFVAVVALAGVDRGEADDC